MVAVQHSVLGVELSDGQQCVGRSAFHRLLGQSAGFDQHAFFHGFGQCGARRQVNERFVVVAESVFRLQVEVHFSARLVALQGAVDRGQQVAAAHQKLNRFVQFIQSFAQAVFELPGQRDHARGVNFHRAIVASQKNARATCVCFRLWM